MKYNVIITISEVNIIKKLISLIVSVIFSILIFVNSIFIVCATDNVSFTLGDVSAKPGRLIKVSVRAKCSKSLCAATFEFMYDKSFLEYRSVKTSDKESEICANDINGKVKTVFLNTYGKNINSETELFTITFKTLKEGNCYVDFNVKECVNKDVNFIDIGDCKSACVKIDKSYKNSDSDSNSVKSSNDKSKTEKSYKESNRNKQPTTKNSPTIDEWGEINPIKNENLKYLMIGISSGILIMIFFLFAYSLGKMSSKKDNNNNTDED